MLGIGCALAGGDSFVAARAAVLGTVTAPASAALRLLGLDPYDMHAITVGLAPELERVADAAARQALSSDPSALPSHSSPAMEILAEVHLTQEVRLFAS